MTDKLREFLSRLQGVEERDGYHVALCPAHDDRQQSLSVTAGDDGRVLLKCHAGCRVPVICHAVGITMSELYPDHGLDPMERKRSERRPKGKLVASYDYHDEDGVLLYQACRYEDDGDGRQGKPTKTFKQRRPNGKGGWSYSTKGIRRVLYRLPELLASDKSQPVYIVEGEKHVDRLVEMGFTATCNVGGAGKWLKSYCDALKGRDVVILPDNDDPGRDHAHKVATALSGVAKSIRTVTLPGLPDKGDVLDWIASGGTADDLRRLTDEGETGIPDPPERKPPTADEVSTDHDRKIVESLGLDVFGEDESGKVKVYSEHHRKTEFIRDVNKLSYPDLLRLCGPVARQVIYTGQDEAPDGMCKLRDVKEAIAILAGYRRVTEQSELGVGIWEARSESGERDSIVMVNAGEASILNGTPGLQRHVRPRYGDRILDTSSSDPWFDHDDLERLVQQAGDVEWRRDVAGELEDIFSRWSYKQNQDVMPAILTGLVIATYSQTIWRWRPQVSIYGQSSSGKSTMFRLLAGDEASDSIGLFGRIAVQSNDSSAAGITQELGNTARIVILDELERNKHRSQILQMLRGSSGGGGKLRGSAHHKSVKFRLRHIVWMAAIENGLRAEPDANRFITVELAKPSEDEMGRLAIPDDAQLQDLGSRLLALSVATARQAKALAEDMRENRPRGHEIRYVESYSVPAACYSIAMGLDRDEATECLVRFLDVRDEDVSGSDHDTLLQTIMESIVEVAQGKRMSVAQALSEAVARSGFETEIADGLEKYGISVRHSTGQPSEAWCDGHDVCVFLSTSAIEKHFLRDSEWRGASTVQILRRAPGAISCTKRIAGRQVRGVLIPYATMTQGDSQT